MDRQLELITRYNKILETAESRIIDRVNLALATSFQTMVDELMRKYPKIQANTNLLPYQRKLLLLSEMKALLNIVGDGTNYEQAFQQLITLADQNGFELGQKLMAEIAEGDFVLATSRIPIEALRYAAEEQTRYLAKYGDDFANRASAAVEQGLIQGWGTKKLETSLISELGVTKVRAEMIARTASLSATNAAAQETYRENDCDGFIWIATVDERVCPICVVRSGNAYRLGDSRPPAHPRCRCFASPFKQAWVEKGLIDRQWYAKFQQDGLNELEKAGGKPNYGLAPFEKGRDKAPEPIWRP